MKTQAKDSARRGKFYFRLTAEEIALLKVAARQQDISTSELVRRAAVAAAGQLLRQQPAGT